MASNMAVADIAKHRSHSRLYWKGDIRLANIKTSSPCMKCECLLYLTYQAIIMIFKRTSWMLELTNSMEQSPSWEAKIFYLSKKYSAFYATRRFIVGFTKAQAVRGSNPGGGEIFRTCPDRPWGPPRLLYNGYRVLPGSKEWPGHEADPSPLSSAVVMKG